MFMVYLPGDCCQDHCPQYRHHHYTGRPSFLVCVCFIHQGLILQVTQYCCSRRRHHHHHHHRHDFAYVNIFNLKITIKEKDTEQIQNFELSIMIIDNFPKPEKEEEKHKNSRFFNKSSLLFLTGSVNCHPGFIQRVKSDLVSSYL